MAKKKQKDKKEHVQVHYRGRTITRVAQRLFPALGWWWTVVFLDGSYRLFRSELPGLKAQWEHCDARTMAEFLEGLG